MPSPAHCRRDAAVGAEAVIRPGSKQLAMTFDQSITLKS